MPSGIIEPKDEAYHGEKVDPVERRHSSVFVAQDLLNDAVDGENREHAMGIVEAMKTYPWACLWAFIMCFTIVSLFPRFSGSPAVPRILDRRTTAHCTC